MKQRFRPTFVLLLTFLVLITVSVVAADSMKAKQTVSFSTPRDSAAAAVTWLYGERQNSDGGFGIDFGTGDPASNIPSTLDATLAVSALGYDPGVATFGAEKSIMDYLNANAPAMVSFAAIDGGSNGKVILALTAARRNARDFAGHDFVAQLKAQYDQESGSYNNSTPFNQGLALAGLAAVSEPIPPNALDWLENLQAADGSWDDGFGTPQNPDATAMATMGLLAGGRDPSDPAINAALQFLASSQLDSGGWQYGAGFGENANSTGLVVQALSATGEDYADSTGKWSKSGTSPLDALLSWQNSTGAFQADFGQGRFDDFFATAQVVPAVLGKPYPFETYLLMMPVVSRE